MSELVDRYVDAGEVVLRVAGELDLASAPCVARALDDIFEAPERPATVVFDAAELVFMDSQGIAILLRALRMAHERGSRLVLRHPTPNVSRVLELTGVGGLFDQDPSLVAPDV